MNIWEQDFGFLSQMAQLQVSVSFGLRLSLCKNDEPEWFPFELKWVPGSYKEGIDRVRKLWVPRGLSESFVDSPPAMGFDFCMVRRWQL